MTGGTLTRRIGLPLAVVVAASSWARPAPAQPADHTDTAAAAGTSPAPAAGVAPPLAPVAHTAGPIAVPASPPPEAPEAPAGDADADAHIMADDLALAPAAPSSRGRWWALGGLAGVYAGLTVFTYFAWYYDEPMLPEFTVGGDGWFGRETYAGGADKLGHIWGNLLIARSTSEILIRGGWDRLRGSLLASGMALAFFTYVEFKDGYYYQFSTADSVGNVIGAGLSALMINVPKVDDLIDFRVEYQPTDEYLDALVEDGDVNALEDYSGQTYYLALHLKAIPGLAEQPYLRWGQYVDVVAGFESRNYQPRPKDPDAVRHQSLFVGVSLNMQHLLGEALGADRHRSRARDAVYVAGHTAFEYVHIPYTTLRVAGADRSAMR